jgi:cell division protein FtsI (penicillin-binding protein 3)
MNKYRKNQSTDVRSSKLLLLYLLIFVAISIFLYRVYTIINAPRDLPSSTAKLKERSKRGSIISADAYRLSYSKKIYEATVNTNSIDPNKLELFIELFSIYSHIDKDVIKSSLLDDNGELIRGRVVLNRHIDAKRANHLKSLAYKMRKLNIFKPIKNSSGVEMLYGLDIVEVGESRYFPLKDTLTPVLGYTRNHLDEGYSRPVGMKGLERYYNKYIKSKRDGFYVGKRDVVGNIVYGDNSEHVEFIDGLDMHLNIPLALQRRVEKVLDHMKYSIDAKEIIAGVMDNKNGKILALASSERFNPNRITQNKIYALNPKFTEYLYEPGSVIKPISLAIVMDRGKVEPDSWIKTDNGRLRIGSRYTITDDEKFPSLSATGVIVHSSNVGISKFVWRISGRELYDGFKRFGLGEQSGIDLSRELGGRIKKAFKLRHQVHSANSSYGYGMHATFIQLLKAYSAFNNSGIAQTPQILDYFKDCKKDQYYRLPPTKPNLRAMSKDTAEKMNTILQKVVAEGTGVKAQYDGLIIGGKTGTAHISSRGVYTKRYNSSFFGFANDANGSRYTIGVLAMEAKRPYKYFASESAVPTFRKIVHQMVKLNYLKPSK